VHPAVLESYLDGNSIEGLKQKTGEATQPLAPIGCPLGGTRAAFRSGEVAILKFLQTRLAKKAV